MTHDESTGFGVMDRREAIRRVTVVLGGLSFVGGSALLTACEQRDDGGEAASGSDFSAEDIAFLDEVAETILPETSTPGAKAAQTGAFMALMVTDTYRQPEQEAFREGMQALDQACQDMHEVGFMEATPEQRLELLQRLDQDQMDRAEEINRFYEEQSEAVLSDQRQEGSAENDAGAAEAISAEPPPTHYFRMMKELALLGYFTSEIGCKQAQRYVEAPGRYDPCVPYQPGDRAWAPHA